MRLKRANIPHHGLGPHSKARRMSGLMAGEHLPQRHNSGNSDAHGYQQSATRQMGTHTGSLKEGDTRRRKGPEGNSKGAPPPGVGKGIGVRGSAATHSGTAGRGGTGRHGKGDNFKGKPTAMSESPTSAWFEQLGAK